LGDLIFGVLKKKQEKNEGGAGERRRAKVQTVECQEE